MSESLLTVRLGNGVEVQGNNIYHLDADIIGLNGTYCISHAHSDHLPKKLLGNEAICSDVTQRCFNGRGKGELKVISDESITMLDAGHMAGSRMFRVNDRSTLLYTGDICTRDRLGETGARASKADVLVIESTYGRPRYVFPPSDEMAALIKDWAEDNLSQGISVAIFAYPFGKSQDLLRTLSDLEPLVDPSVHRASSLIFTDSDRPNYRLYTEELARSPFVMVCTSNFRRTSQASCWRKDDIRTAAVSGWAIDQSYRYQMQVDEAFPFSDHADFEELISFTKACAPSLVLTHHGFAEDLASEIVSRLGIDARPLLRGQRAISEF